MINKEKINQLTKEEKEEIFRMVWHERVSEDVQTLAEWMSIEPNKEQIAEIARLYVYEKEYDKHLNHWRNLEHLIEKVYYESE